jgi:meiotic recombination protein SPO11
MYKPELPMLALTDFDPDGINIFSCYRYGTQAFSHESMDGDMKISWLGIKSGHLHELEVDLPEDSANTQANIAGSSSVSQRQKTTSGLTKRDRKYAVGMLKKLDARGPRDGQIEDMVREIQLQLMLGVTIEIQAMVDHGDLISWLDERLQNIFFA